jgi:probable F420-dependent oxidoreductase
VIATPHDLRTETGGFCMKLGLALPSLGPVAGPDALTRTAQRAEALGYHSLWVADRLLYPVRPRSPYPATADGVLPEYFKRSMDPVETLTFVAAHTRRITLGTSVLDMPFYNPVVLARRLATLDVLSGGRLRVGLGQAWSVDELEAVGADPKARAERADEFIGVLKALWGPDPVEFQGRHFRVARSIVGLKPVQTPHPPIYLAAYVARALRRAAMLADGWLPSAVPLPALGQMAGQLRALARETGRDPARLEVIYLTGTQITDEALDDAKRGLLHGSAAQIRGDLGRLRDAGVTEVIVWAGAATLDDYLAALARFREAAG